MDEWPFYGTAPNWGQFVIFATVLVLFGLLISQLFEWLRKCQEREEYKSALLDISNQVKQASAHVQQHFDSIDATPRSPGPETSRKTPATHIGSRCLPSCLSNIVRLVHGPVPCSCKTEQCQLDKNEPAKSHVHSFSSSGRD
ncbi:hypothetical protein BU25DRAFT_469567 [Macroventuria anomochaeta]|uniref:Uncharacterized protein n=1 Tax=Macroventuria anomochaeta TaxID=301207 RepID=A0ACB6RZI9_9PLEO|nr:uncharacterized protein BU25DRAFT_469567 [Macroventuria anomochaeta]KAF2627133.1 hypothetical protein BU25DRAFT_469567 [Macroventuria anomochaeta]